MAHTLLCGQRRYTMPFVVIPTGTSFYDSDLSAQANIPMKVQNIRPPGGIIISARQIVDVNGTFFRTQVMASFVTEHGTSLISLSEKPTLYLSDGVIQSIRYASNDTLEYFQYWTVPDVSYLAQVESSR